MPAPEWFAGAQLYGVDVSHFLDADGDGCGDLAGVERRLGYIRSLGFDALWLLPFFPSSDGDNGYDVVDYYGVDRRLGGLDGARSLIRSAHRRGMRIVVDLPLHHTSRHHPWFLAAESDPDSWFRDYYIWSDVRPPDSPELNCFPEEENGVWARSARAGAWYRHFFYSFQPDLRHENDRVWAEIERIVDFWVAMGADGFRFDAIPHFFDDKGVAGARADRDGRMTQLHRFARARSPQTALLGEVNVPLDEMGAYAETLDGVFDFASSANLFLALARGDAAPLAHVVAARAERWPHAPWVNFVRNLDELSLAPLAPEDQEEVHRVFSPLPYHRIYGRGIRRAWAPMMADERMLRMTASLLFALPGRPLLMAGQEIGTGDDHSRPGRDALRLPMQWTSGRAGGFSSKRSRGISRTSRAGGAHGYRRRNVQRAVRDRSSLLHLVRRVSRARRRLEPAAPAGWEADALGPVLRIRCRGFTTIHNLSDRPAPAPAAPGPLVLGSDARVDELEPYGFRWYENEEAGG